MANRISDSIFWIAVVSCAVAQLFILRAVFLKPLVPAPGDESSSEPHSPLAPSVPQPRRASEFAWSVLPAVLLVLLFMGAWRTMHRPAATNVPSMIAPDAGATTQP